MSLTREEAQELAQIIHARSGSGRSSKPKFRVVSTPKPSVLDAIARDSHIRRILWLRRQYGLNWLVDQAAFDVATIYELGDEDLIALLVKMEKARECISEGIPFDDAGLVQSVFSRQPQAMTSREAERQADLAAIATIQDARKEARHDDDDPCPF